MPKARRWGALTVLSASLVIITMDMTILTIALPEMAAELNPTSDQQLWILDVYSLVLAGLLVSVAAIADRWGRKRMLILGYIIFAIASLVVLFANSAAAVIAIRAFLGIGGAMIMPTTLSMIRVIFTDPKERTTALSIWAAVSGIGMVIGPRAVQSVGLVIAGGGLLYIGLIAAPLTLTQVIIGLCLVGMGMGSLAIGTEFIMGGVPEDKAGNAGALFRKKLAEAPGFDELTAFSPQLAAHAQDSLGAAMHIAGEAGLADLASEAARAFTSGLQITGIIGGLIMLGVSAVAFFLVPKGTLIGASLDH